METVRIRPMEARDIPAVAALERSIFSEPWTEENFADALALSSVRFFVAELPEGSVAGYAGMYIAGDDGEITNVAVAETFRRQGVGGMLLDRLLQEAARGGVRQVFLEVRESNGAAIRLYQTYGFAPCGRRERFYRFPDEAALILQKTFS